MTKKREKLFIIACFACGLVMLTVLALGKPAMMGCDSVGYLLPIHSLVQGNGYTVDGRYETIFPPGLGILSYLAYQFCHDIELSGAMVSAFSYLLLIPTVFYLARRRFGDKTAVLATCLITFNPLLIRHSLLAQSLVPFSLFLMLSLSTHITVLEDRTVISAAKLGLFLSVTYLIRPEGFLVALLSLTSLFVLRLKDSELAPGNPSDELRKRVLVPAVAVTIFVICISPYVLFLREHTGHWTFSGKLMVNLKAGESLVEGHVGTKQETKDGKTSLSTGARHGGATTALEYISSRGKRFTMRVGRNLTGLLFWITYAVFPGLVCLAILWGIYPFIARHRLFENAAWSPRTRNTLYSFILFLAPLSVYLFFFVFPRLVVPYSLLILILISRLVVEFLLRMEDSCKKPRLGTAVLIAALIALIVPVILIEPMRRIPRLPVAQYLPESVYSALHQRNGPEGIRAAALWLRNGRPEWREANLFVPINTTIMKFYLGEGKELSKNNVIAFSPATRLAEVAGNLCSRKGQLLIIDNNGGKISLYWRNLSSLWNDPQSAENYGLEHIHSDPDGLFQVYGCGGNRRRASVSQ